MKIRIELEIELDPQEWQAFTGCERDEVPEKVKAYVLSRVREADMLDQAEVRMA